MSAPAVEKNRYPGYPGYPGSYPLDLPVAEGTAGLNFIAIARRRWPWVLVGLFVGVVGGLLAYSSRPAVYQSNAQLLVVKKRENLDGRGDTRMAYMEDYMATQATILKSEKVLTNAARRIPTDLHNPFPTETTERAKILAGIFSVGREKDPSNPSSVNNVLNVSVRSANPEDCQKILEIVIEAYREELRNVFDEATVERIQLLKNAIAQNEKKTKENINERDISISQIRKVSAESPEVLQSRFSKGVELRRLARNEESEMLGWLAQIEKAGEDKKNRAVLMQRLMNYMRTPQQAISNGHADPNDLKYQWQELEAQMAEYGKKYGDDHPLMQQIRARIEFLKKKYGENNPGDPEGKLDGLAQLEQFFRGRLSTIEEQIKSMNAEINNDSLMLTTVLPLKQKVEALDKYIDARTKLIDQYEADLLQTDLTRASGGYQANALNAPSRELTPVAPKLSQNLLLGMAVGLLFGVGLAALAELSDKGFRSPADIRSRLGLAVIGHIPPIRTNHTVENTLDLEPTLVSALRPKSVEAEAYRGVRTALYFNAAGSTHQMIQVTSPHQGDGKSTLAANLAISIAQSGKNVLLVDCDMRRPRVHKVFRLPEAGPGLAAVINGTAPLSAAIQRTVVENLSLLPCGKKPANPAELLTSPNFADLLDRLKADYDYVILDTPPVLAVSDPSAVAPRADGVILVFRMTSKVRPAAERAREQLAQIGANIIGVVVNGSGRSTAESGYGYSYGYSSNYGTEYTGYVHEGQYMDNYAESDEETPPKKG